MSLFHRIAVKTYYFGISAIFFLKTRIELSFNTVYNMSSMGSPVLPQGGGGAKVMCHGVLCGFLGRRLEKKGKDKTEGD